MKKQIKLLTVLVTLSLLTVGVFSSFKSNDFRNQTVGAWDPNYYATDTSGSGEDTTGSGSGSGSGSGEEFYGKMLTTVPCTVSVTCPGGRTISTHGFSMQCLGNTGYCHPSTEAGCDAPEPNCN